VDGKLVLTIISDISFDANGEPQVKVIHSKSNLDVGRAIEEKCNEKQS